MRRPEVLEMEANADEREAQARGHRRRHHDKSMVGVAGHETCSVAPPDGGWSWIIMFSVVTVTVMSPSIVGCYGIILADVQRTMNTTVSQTALVPTLTQSLNHLCAPLTAVLGLTFSFRKVGILGGILMSMGISLTFFATSIAAVYISFGIVAGVGFGLANKAGLFVVNEYFDKRRGLATGTYYAGAAVCRLVFPVIVQNLMHEYSYPGALLVWGAILANICVVSSLYQPVKWHVKHVPGPQCSDNAIRNENGSAPEKRNDSKTKVDDRSKSPTTATINEQNRNGSLVVLSTSLEIHSVDYVTGNDVAEPEMNGSVKSGDKSGSARWLTDEDKLTDDERKETDSFLLTAANRDGGRKFPDSNPDKSGPPSRKTSWRRSASAVSIASGIISNHDVGEVLSSLVRDGGASVAPSEHHPPPHYKACCCKWMHKCLYGLHFSLFAEPAFYVVCASGVCHSFATVNAYVFLPLLGRSRGLGDSSAFLLSSIGIGEIFGRLAIPWLRDLKLLSAKYAYMTGAALSALAAFGLAFTDSFAAMVALSIILGIGAGAMVGLGSVLCVEAVGLALLPSAISFQQFSQGFFTLPSGLLLGWIRDVTGNYTQCFYLMAAVYSGSFWIWLGSIVVGAIVNRKRKNSGRQ